MPNAETENQNGVQSVIDIAIASSRVALTIEEALLDGRQLAAPPAVELESMSIADSQSAGTISLELIDGDSVDINLTKTWMQLAKDKFARAGGTLDEHEHAALDCITDPELETLQALAKRLETRAPGFTGDAGGIY